MVARNGKTMMKVVRLPILRALLLMSVSFYGSSKFQYAGLQAYMNWQRTL